MWRQAPFFVKKKIKEKEKLLFAKQLTEFVMD